MAWGRRCRCRSRCSGTGGPAAPGSRRSRAAAGTRPWTRRSLRGRPVSRVWVGASPRHRDAPEVQRPRVPRRRVARTTTLSAVVSEAVTEQIALMTASATCCRTAAFLQALGSHVILRVRVCQAVLVHCWRCMHAGRTALQRLLVLGVLQPHVDSCCLKGCKTFETL